MLHLAQVQSDPISGKHCLQLLAHESGDRQWQMGTKETPLFKNLNRLNLVTGSQWPLGILVLVEINGQGEIASIQDAKDWVLKLVQQQLSQGGITPHFVKQEQAKIEQWRQEMTAQSQDLTRRQLELETRREQLEELEKKLHLEQEKLALQKCDVVPE